MKTIVEQIPHKVEQYYSHKVDQFGSTAKGVDWNSTESQYLRFNQLLQVCDTIEGFSLIDFGCGYGALLDYINGNGVECNYQGYDISESMLEHARHKVSQNSRFTSQLTQLELADYVVASGVFNVKLNTSNEDWKAYMLQTVETIASLSKRGFAFNVLTSYSDKLYMRDDLYYADPLFWFDHCKKMYSMQVALLHDYPLYEFTILVRLG